MKKIMCLVSAMVSLSAVADTQLERDSKLIRDLELLEGPAVESQSAPAPSNHSSLNNALLNNSLISDADNTDATANFAQTRVVKVILNKQQSAESIASELDLELLASHDGRVAAFKAGDSQNMTDIVASLKAHSGVIEAKQEMVVQLNKPQ